MLNKNLYQGLKHSTLIFSCTFLLAACGAASNSNPINKASNNVTKPTVTTATTTEKKSTKKQEENTQSTATTTAGVNATCDAVKPKVKGLPVPNEVEPPRVFNTNEIYWYKLDKNTYPKYKDAQYEYSLDKGCTWTLAQKSPISFANLKLQAGDVQLRVKAKAGQYNAGHIASNTDENTTFIKLKVRIKNKAPDKNTKFNSLRTSGLSLYAADNMQSANHGRSGGYNVISKLSLGHNLQYGDAYNLKVVKQPDGLYQHCKAVKHTQGVISKELVTAEVECDRADKKLIVSEFLTISDAEKLVAGVALNAFYLDKDGFLIADKSKGKIYQVSMQGKHEMIFEFKTKPVHIAGLALNSNAKKLYVLEATEGKVYLLDLTKKPIQAKEIASGFKQPKSLALVIKDYPCTGADKDCEYSESHHLYVADTGNDLIKRINLDNNQVREIATIKGVKQLAVIEYARTRANIAKTDNQLWVITDGIYRLEDLDRFSGSKLQVKEVIKQAGFTSVVALNPLKRDPLLFLAAKNGDKAGIRRFDMEASSQDENKYAELPLLSLPQIGMPNTLIEDATKGVWYMSKANTIYKVENPAQ